MQVTIDLKEKHLKVFRKKFKEQFAGTLTDELIQQFVVDNVVFDLTNSQSNWFGTDAFEEFFFDRGFEPLDY